jgi:outer membrane immunogenic protein
MKAIPSFAGCVAAFLLSATTAYAADVVPTSPSYDWSGAYVGLHAGYLWSDVDYDEPEFPDFDLN